jgi:hypothetical protein
LELKASTWMDSQWWNLWRNTFCRIDLSIECHLDCVQIMEKIIKMF